MIILLRRVVIKKFINSTIVYDQLFIINYQLNKQLINIHFNFDDIAIFRLILLFYALQETL